MKGTVKWFSEIKGYGFIKVQGMKDVFFHKSALPKGYLPENDDYVEFNLVHAERGDAAENIAKA